LNKRHWQYLDEMPYAFGAPLSTGVIRSVPEDFQVDEILGFEADGEGEHLLLQVRKKQTNTHWLAEQLAKLASIPVKDVSYAGMKDRHAVTTQWYSLRLAGRPEPCWSTIQSDLIQILALHRHRRKLRRGCLKGNRFQIRIRGLQVGRQCLEERLERLRKQGMPNYFGNQRFGHKYQNLEQAERLFSPNRGRMSRTLRGLVMSAVRSQLFNQVLAARIEANLWNAPLSGDYFKLDGSRRGFHDDQEQDSLLARRCQQQDIHPSGPLWGRGRTLVTGQAAELEEQALGGLASWQYGLEHLGLEQERRALRVRLQDLTWHFETTSDLVLHFFLPAGCFATVLLRELIRPDY
jgi:tRNA pseudouridine13 synthase